MGHIHLGVLPGSKGWKEVVALLEEGAPDEDILQASAVAAERELASAADDRIFVECVRLLSMIPVAARAKNFGRALRDLGIPAGDDPDLLSVISATGQWLDRFTREGGRGTDFGELSRRALLSTLGTAISNQLPSLFEATTSDVKIAASNLSRQAGFSPYARAFFTRLLSETLSNWLDRTLSAHVGPERRFSNMGDRVAFDRALSQYSSEATRIVREFASAWFGKTLHREGKIDARHAAIFGAVAFKKISAELRRKRGLND